MRKRGVRLDLFICMLLAAGVFYLVWLAGTKIEAKVEEKKAVVETVDFANAETGLGAGEDIPRVTSFEELSAYRDCFTIEMTTSRYYNYGTFEGDEYVWRAIKLDDDTVIAARVNEDNVQTTEDFDVILPIGKIVEEEPEVIDDIVECLEGKAVNYVPDAYIDMDGEADSTVKKEAITMTAMLLISLVPFVLFVVYILLVFGIHAIFCKLGIFPPVFNKKRSAE